MTQEEEQEYKEKIGSPEVEHLQYLMENPTPTPSDTFIDSRLKEFDKEIVDYFWNKETTVGTQRLSLNHIEKIKDFLKSSLLQQRQEIEREIDSIKIDKAHTYSSENADEYRAYDNGQRDMLGRIKQLLK